MERHTTGDCGERVVACRWCDLGCTARVKQAMLPAHDAEAGGAHLALARDAILAQQLLTGMPVSTFPTAESVAVFLVSNAKARAGLVLQRTSLRATLSCEVTWS